ncbi:alpha/beta hydrolase [Chryseolinea lacunae]|uniref:Dienelactone hydrolase family protein n=1 Tax=Chryseolinea lacunae TaxID=2801331 RepID=A0ABS1L1T9_9BACT|nr:dienelactone hydrolase family protein [Chryseolinea lacunae]MBL0745624.1 dienelactone hydrolase family protein [Chryseolinea lacunae]
MHTKNIVTGGKKLTEAKKALIMLHGRGATAEDILGLASHLNVADFAWLAPQATNYTWYPYSFLAPPNQNEPWLSSALALIKDIVSDINAAGISNENIYVAGFSQGACLTLEFVTRNAQRWGGVAAFTGGLIGDKLYTENYAGDFKNTPVFIGSSNPDPHVPVERVQASTALLKSMHASVTEKIYPGLGHTIATDEIALANKLIFS